VKQKYALGQSKRCFGSRGCRVIHTDFEKGFIKAEVINYDDFVAAGSNKKATELGKVRQEGKDYVMEDGDIVFFKFNV